MKWPGVSTKTIKKSIHQNSNHNTRRWRKEYSKHYFKTIWQGKATVGNALRSTKQIIRCFAAKRRSSRERFYPGVDEDPLFKTQVKFNFEFIYYLCREFLSKRKIKPATIVTVLKKSGSKRLNFKPLP